MTKSIAYILDFLIGGSNVKAFSCRVGYTSDVAMFPKYNVVIIPSSFFHTRVYGTPDSLPVLPLQEVEGVPLLFGAPEIEWVGATLVVHADIVASAFFLLSRYEEIRRREVRDEHGRFPGKESLPYRAGFIHRPVVDEYGRLLRGWLREAGVNIPDLKPGIRKIWLTHDVDVPFYCRSYRNVVREVLAGRGFAKVWKMYNAPLEKDPFYTFPWLIERNAAVREKAGVRKCQSVFFIKAGGKSEKDKPHYSLNAANIQTLLKMLKKEQAVIGLHTSYDAGGKPSLILHEKEQLEKAIQSAIKYNRHHYLANREPEDLLWLVRAGITDDFTMGYSDVSGFRLGTSRPVRWIDPASKRLSSLLLHPLTLMDVTLSESKYMGFAYEEALRYSLQLIDQVETFGGELTLLWHNNTVSEVVRPGQTAWHRELYAALLEELKKR